MTQPVFSEITEAQLLPRIVHLGGNLYGAAFTLMKMVPARHILLAAAARGELGPESTVVETTSGTFGLALAMQCALLRLPFVMVSDPVVDSYLYRRLADLGTEIVLCERPLPVGGFQQARLQRLAGLLAERPFSFCPRQYENPDNPASYAIVAAHLQATLGRIGCLVGPVGSGGSMCGTAAGLRADHPGLRVIGVDTQHSVLFGAEDGPRTLRGLGNSLLPGNLDHRSFDEIHWVNAAEAFDATRELHRRHALFQGPTSGAAYRVGRWWAARNPDQSCVVMLPDEGHRYLGTAYAGDPAEPAAAEPEQVPHPRSMGSSWSRYDWGRRTLAEVLAGPTRAAPVGASAGAAR